MPKDRNHRPISEIRSDYRATLSRANTVSKLIAQAESDLVVLKDEWRELQGGPWDRSDGKVTRLKTELAYATLREEDEKATPVVWCRLPGRMPKSADWIVDKVTPKRIYIRRRGSKLLTQYKRDGIPVGACYHDPYMHVEDTLKHFTGKIPPCK
jgi:hypothetical protein